MNLEQRLNNLATAIGADVKALRLADGDLTALSTTAKASLVAAINEVLAVANAASLSSSVIDDTKGDGDADKTWSADKIYDHVLASINSLRDELRAGAGSALDTFAEVAAQLAADQSGAQALATAVANRVRYDEAQALTNVQQGTARSNIAAASAAGLMALADAVGNTDADLVAVYTTAKS